MTATAMLDARALTAAQATEALRRGREVLAARPSNLGLAPDALAYRTHAPVISTYRDDDALGRSNYAVVREDLERYDREDTADGTPDVVTERFRDQLFGWTEHVCVRVERPARPGDPLPTVMPTDALLQALTWHDALADYPVADEEHYSALELEELEDYLAGELDGQGGTWTARVLDAIGEGGNGYAVETVDLERVAHLAWHMAAEPVLESARAWLQLRTVGDGQLTLDGDTVRVPDAPSLDALAALVDPWDIGDDTATRALDGGLEPPETVLAAVRASDTYAAVLDTAAAVVAVLQPA